MRNSWGLVPGSGYSLTRTREGLRRRLGVGATRTTHGRGRRHPGAGRRETATGRRTASDGGSRASRSRAGMGSRATKWLRSGRAVTARPKDLAHVLARVARIHPRRDQGHRSGSPPADEETTPGGTASSSSRCPGPPEPGRSSAGRLQPTETQHAAERRPIPSTSASPHGVRRLARDRARFHRFDAETGTRHARSFSK